jgi:ferredoxin
MAAREDATERGVSVGDVVVLDVAGLDELIHRLGAGGYRTTGPVVRDGAVVPGDLGGAADLPRGAHDEQSAGRYRLTRDDDPRLFDWAVGPASWKSTFFPASDVVWRARRDAEGVTFDDGARAEGPTAVVGARPCEAAALDILDRVFTGGEYQDPHYARRRDSTFLVVAECTSPSATCFCPSAGTGPDARGAFDLALIELHDDGGHRFVIRIGSSRGADVLEGLATPAGALDLEARERLLAGSVERMERSLDFKGAAQVLARNPEHPRWAEVAERCLSCGNCTLVCPTCFCSDVRDTTDLEGTVTRNRNWASCFDLDHSYLHGGAVRASTSSRYRQWLTHKLSTWWDQFDTAGCVGCGRCVTWCPVGIDLIEEVDAIAARDGAVAVATPTTRGAT